ncbi:hypothetical protein [Nocardia grenadensis]|uniref:hypothetical protein n=1 Tax=Nocardia grenadensis TaxID=931537 RepID=UPI0007A526DB|nr:hypothetical protein [Nocardia grenadensis]
MATELTREVIEAHAGLKLTDWQWHCVKAIQSGRSTPQLSTPRLSGRTAAMHQLFDIYRALGHRIERVGRRLYRIHPPKEGK